MQKNAFDVSIICDYTSIEKALIKGTSDSACYDIASSGHYVINSGERKLISTGLYFNMSKDIEALIRPRSGLAYKFGITIMNSPGTIDMDYKDEIKVLLINHSNKAFTVTLGMRIAQVAFRRIGNININMKKNIVVSKVRNGGFGSTGI